MDSSKHHEHEEIERLRNLLEAGAAEQAGLVKANAGFQERNTWLTARVALLEHRLALVAKVIEGKLDPLPLEVLTEEIENHTPPAAADERPPDITTEVHIQGGGAGVSA